MDMNEVERTMQFLLQQSARHDEEIGRIERLMGNVVERQNQMDEALATLIEAQIKTQEQFERTEAQFKRTDDKIALLGERIDKLVSAIGVIATRLPEN